MFDAFCPRCAARVLLGPSRIVSVENHPEGIVMGYRCVCGTPGSQVVGRRRPAPTMEAADPVPAAAG